MAEVCLDKVNDLMWKLVSSLITADIDLVMKRSLGKLTRENARLRYWTIIENKSFSEWNFLGNFPKKEDDLFRNAWELIDYFQVALHRDIMLEQVGILDDPKSLIETSSLINLVHNDIDITTPFEKEYEVGRRVELIRGPLGLPGTLPSRIVLIPSTSDQIEIIKNFLRTLNL